MRVIEHRILRAFVTVAKEGNVSRAAEQLHLSQPAVSLQIKQLSEFTGVELFTRTPNGLLLTREGAALLPQAERTLAALTDFGDAAQRITGTVRGPLRIGTILDPEFTRLGDFLRELVNLAPELEPELQHGMSGTVRDKILRGELDAGFYLGDPNRDVPAPRGAGSSPLFHTQVLTPFTYRVVAPAGWGPQVLGRDWAALARLPWVLTPPESVHHRALREILEPLGVTQTQVAVVDQEASMLALVRSGIGLSLARDALAITESHRHGLVVADKVSVDSKLTFICLARNRASAPVHHAHEALARAWRL